MKYVILLRGVNVGGKHRVSKADLKSSLESLAFQDVQVYINSGNAVFTAVTKPDPIEVRQMLEKRFGFTIPILLLTGKEVCSIATAIPPEWTNDVIQSDKSGQKSDVLYLFETIDTPEILTKLGYDSKIESMLYVKHAVITTISRVNQTKGSLQKIVGTKLYANMTIRNVNTARKLAELAEE